MSDQNKFVQIGLLLLSSEKSPNFAATLKNRKILKKLIILKSGKYWQLENTEKWKRISTDISQLAFSWEHPHFSLKMRSSYSPFEILHISTSFLFLFIKIFHITAMPLVSYFCPESFIFLRYSPVFKILERGESHYSIVCEEYSRNVVQREHLLFLNLCISLFNIYGAVIHEMECKVRSLNSKAL